MRSNQAKKLDFNGLSLDGTGSSGSMSASGTPIITETGLVSATNFPLNQVNANPAISTSSTSYVDISGSSLAPFTTQGTTNVFIDVVVSAYNQNFSADGSVVEVAVVDSVEGTIISTTVIGNWYLTSIIQDGLKNVTGWNIAFTDQTVTIPVVLQMSAGSHTLKLQYRVSGTGTANLDFFYLGYIILGQQV